MEAEETKIYPKSKRFRVPLLIGSVVFGLAFGILILDTIASGGAPTDALVAVFAGAISVWCLFLAFGNKPYVIVSSRGVESVTRFQRRFVEWREVGAFTLLGNSVVPLICAYKAETYRILKEGGTDGLPRGSYEADVHILLMEIDGCTTGAAAQAFTDELNRWRDKYGIQVSAKLDGKGVEAPSANALKQAEDMQQRLKKKRRKGNVALIIVAVVVFFVSNAFDYLW